MFLGHNIHALLVLTCTKERWGEKRKENPT